jgi:hypothetical protein
MSGEEGFGAHHRRHGPRLAQIQATGESGVHRQYRDAGEGAGRVEGGDAATGAVQVSLSADVGDCECGSGSSARVLPVGLGEGRFVSADPSGGRAQARPAGVGGKKRGPPPGPRPWLGLGISRATYWRRKKEGAL